MPATPRRGGTPLAHRRRPDRKNADPHVRNDCRSGRKDGEGDALHAAGGARQAFVHSPAFRRWYHAGLALKGFDGFLETIGGMLLLALPPERLFALFRIVTARELSNHPDDWIGHAITQLSNALSVSSERFAGIYLIGHGIVKLLLVLGLWRERAWAFPIALSFLGFFLLYQLYRIAHTHSIALMIFSAFDLFVLWVVWQDRQLVRERRTAGGRAGHPVPPAA